MKFAIVGDGALGRFVGAHLINDGNDVVFFTRPNQDTFEPEISYAVCGADIRLNISNAQCLSQPGEAGLCDIVFICVRRHQTEAAIESLRPVLSHDTALISLQQGFENFKPLKTKFESSFVVGGACSYSVEKDQNGDVTQLGTDGKIVVGELNGEPSWRLEIVEAALQSAGLVGSKSENIQQEICLRAAFESVTGLCLLSRLHKPGGENTFVLLLNESVAVLEKIGKNINPNFVPDATRRFDSLPQDLRPLLVRDFQKRRNDEVDGLAGWTGARARELGIGTPIHDKLLTELELL